MSELATLPRIMVAPNGARKIKADHPAIPLTIEETVATAKACSLAGADGIHAHIRKADGTHLLDAGVYRELLAELAREVPTMAAQITTEAVGIYSAEEQEAVVRGVCPKLVSVGLNEMCPNGREKEARNFYHWASEAGVAVQHILYGAEEIPRLLQLAKDGVVPTSNLQLLFVLGRYTVGQISAPEDLDPFLRAWQKRPSNIEASWGLCAFGPKETDCLIKALSLGGAARVGFENNFLMKDGSVAPDNAARVAEIKSRAGL